MEANLEPGCYRNPCYSVKDSAEQTQGMNPSIQDDRSDNDYDYVISGVHSQRFVQPPETKSMKPIVYTKKMKLKFDVSFFIAIVSIAISVVALALSLYSAFKPSTTERALNVMRTNDTMSSVTQDQLKSLMIVVESSVQNLSNELAVLKQTWSSYNVAFVTQDQLRNALELSAQNVSNNVQSLTDIFDVVFDELNYNITLLNSFVTNLASDFQALRNFLTGHEVPQCGPGIWHRVIYLNMSDSSQQCPPAWREYTTPVRSCGRPDTNTPNCASSMFSTQETRYGGYARVCGKIIGYQFGGPEQFYGTSSVPDGHYVDGVSVTHGNPRTHIWTFAAGRSERTTDTRACPCANPSARASPSFVGNNYFCESGTTSSPSSGTFYSSDPLWDGAGCVNGQCCTFNSPPWFNGQLPNSTTDDIEVRICGTPDTNNEDIPIELIEIYVQ